MLQLSLSPYQVRSSLYPRHIIAWPKTGTQCIVIWKTALAGIRFNQDINLNAHLALGQQLHSPSFSSSHVPNGIFRPSIILSAPTSSVLCSSAIMKQSGLLNSEKMLKLWDTAQDIYIYTLSLIVAQATPPSTKVVNLVTKKHGGDLDNILHVHDMHTYNYGIHQVHPVWNGYVILLNVHNTF